MSNNGSSPLVLWYNQLGMNDVDRVGGKNASLGEMITNLSGMGVSVPNGFATTADAFNQFLDQSGVNQRIYELLDKTDIDDVTQLAKAGAQIRQWIIDTPFQPELENAIREAYAQLSADDENASFAVRSSATAEDMPDASFAGQQETFLNVQGFDAVLVAVKHVFASLFNVLPKGGAGARPEVKKELAVLMRPQVLSALLTTVLGAGAMFTLYTYISPVLQSITHATPVFVTAMLVLIGVGFSIGNYLGGKLADRSVNGTLKGFLLLLMVIMLAIPFLARNEFGAAISMVVWGAATFAVVPPLQMRVMRVASEAPGLSSSVNIGAFNLGNALGAAAGGAVISAGLGYSFVPVMGAIVAGLALLLVFMSARKQPEAVCVANS